MLCLIVRGMVRDREAVSVTPIYDTETAITFKVRVAEPEVGKLIGKHGATARSLRHILTTIAKENGENFCLSLPDRSIDQLQG